MDVDEPLSAGDIQQMLDDLGAYRRIAATTSTLTGTFASANGLQTLLVLDTNVLLSSLAFLDALVTRLAAVAEPPCAMLLPRVVIGELDGLKKSRRITSAPNAPPIRRSPSASMHARVAAAGAGSRSGVEISQLAHKATQWLERTFRRSSRLLYGQQPAETTGLPVQNVRLLPRWLELTEQNDDRILDAALYWCMRGTRAVRLITECSAESVGALHRGCEPAGQVARRAGRGDQAGAEHAGRRAARPSRRR